MNIDARLESLGERHRNLEGIIEEEMRRPTCDDLRISDLKRQKLAIKDEMRNLECERPSH